MDKQYINQDYDEALKNRFTAYLKLALVRKRKDFLEKKNNENTIYDNELLGKSLSVRYVGQGMQDQWDAIIHAIENKHLKRGLLTLDKMESTILYRRAVLGEKFDTIASDLRIPKGTVATKYYRIRNRLEKVAKGGQYGV